MTCKDCFRCPVCDTAIERIYRNDGCSYFKNKSKIIELPCKVGDVVYKLWGCGRNGKSVAEFVVRHIDIDYYPQIEISFQKQNSKTRSYFFAKLSDFGKKVFLTKEEAKKALKEMMKCQKNI